MAEEIANRINISAASRVIKNPYIIVKDVYHRHNVTISLKFIPGKHFTTNNLSVTSLQDPVLSGTFIGHKSMAVLAEGNIINDEL